MITIHTYSTQTKETTGSKPFDDITVLERFLSNKIRQYLRVRPTADGTLFSFGVLPPIKERNGAYVPAGVVIMKNGVPEIIHVPRFVGTLASLAQPATYKRYIRYENRPERDHCPAKA